LHNEGNAGIAQQLGAPRRPRGEDEAHEPE
jgi:hypothetical protein